MRNAALPQGTSPRKRGEVGAVPHASPKSSALLRRGVVPDRQPQFRELPGHERHLLKGFHELEGVFGNKYRWIGGEAKATLRPVQSGAKRLRIRGHASEHLFAQGSTPQATASVNGRKVGEWQLDRTGLFILEADLPDAAEYQVAITVSPVWQFPPDERRMTVTLSMIRLTPRD